MWKSRTARAFLLAVFILVLILAAFLNFHGLYQAFVKDQSQMSDIKDRASTLQSLITIIAIVFGGIYAWLKLQLFRDFEPHLTVTHEVNHRAVSPSYVHIDVTAVLHNSSRVKIELRKADFAIQWVAPTSDELVLELYDEVFDDGVEDYLQWPTIDEGRRNWDRGELLVEPGELHKETYEFLVPRAVQTVLVYTYFRNPLSPKPAASAEGWGTSTVYDIMDVDEVPVC